MNAPSHSRLLIISQGIDGGIAPLSSSLAHGLQESGWACAVRYIGRPATSRFVPIDQKSGIDSRAIVTGKARSVAEALGLLTSIIPVIGAARKNRPTKIIFAGFMCALLYAPFLRLFTSAEFIYWDHAPQNTFLKIKQILFPLSLSSINRFVSISASTASALTRYFGISSNKINIIPNGVDPARWNSLPPAPDFTALKIIMPARIDLNQKDPITLVKAAAMLHKKGVKIIVTFVGSGIDADTLKNAIIAEGCSDIVSIIPHSDDVHSLVAKHNVLCLSTHFEGLPTVVIEGMLAKRIVVASRVAGCVDLIKNGVTGILFELASIHDCAIKLQSLQVMDNIQQIIDAAYNEATSLYTPEAMCKNFRCTLEAKGDR